MRRKTLSQRRFDIPVIIAIFLLLLCLLPLVWELAAAVLQYLQQAVEKVASPGTRPVSPYREGRRAFSSGRAVSATILWHTERMSVPDKYDLALRQADQARKGSMASATLIGSSAR